MVSSIGQNDSLTNYLLYANSMMVDQSSGEGVAIDGAGNATKVPPEMVAEMLAAAGLMLQNGKIVGALDKIEQSPANANATLGLGGKPPLPSISGGAPIGEVKNSVNMLKYADDIQTAALLMNALLILMRGAEQDRATNDSLENTMFKMKDSAKKGDIESGKVKVKADLEAAREQYNQAMASGAVQIVTAAASAGAAGVGTLAGALASLGSAIVTGAVSIYNANQQLNSAKNKDGAVHRSGEADIESTVYKQMAENAQAIIDLAKESGDSCRDMWKAALKLISAVEQRATQNIQTFTNI